MKRTLGAAAVLVLALCVPGAAAKPQRTPHAVMTVHVLTLTQQEARKSGVLHVEIRSRRDIDVKLRGLVLGSSQSPADWATADHPFGLSVDRHELAHGVIHQLQPADADPHLVLNQLYQYSPLQRTASIILLALVDGRPRTLSLKEMMEEYLRHRLPARACGVED